jgi:soluble lytic murein transglycosylase-like protein
MKQIILQPIAPEAKSKIKLPIWLLATAALLGLTAGTWLRIAQATEAKQEAVKAAALTEERGRIKGFIHAWNPRLEASDIAHQAERVQAGSIAKRVPVRMILLAAGAEGGFWWRGVNLTGHQERGILQVLPSTMRSVMPEGDPQDFDDCFEAGLRYLAMCYAKAGGDSYLTVAYHNAGMGGRPDVALIAARAHIAKLPGVERVLNQFFPPVIYSERQK